MELREKMRVAGRLYGTHFQGNNDVMINMSKYSATTEGGHG